MQVSQGGRRCAAGTLLLDTPAPDVVRHAVAAPEVPGPYDSEPYDMAVTGRDVRVVDGAYTDDPGAPVGPPVLDAWVRFRAVPDDPYLHPGLLAQFAGHMSIAAASARTPASARPRPRPRPTARSPRRSTPSPSRSTARSASTRWMLYRHRSTFAGDGMTHAECRVHDEAGSLLVSFTVDAMVRRFAGAAPRGRRPHGAVSLTTGRGPLGPRPAGRFSAPLPEGVVYVEPFRRRVRGVTGGRTLVDSERVPVQGHRVVLDRGGR